MRKFCFISFWACLLGLFLLFSCHNSRKSSAAKEVTFKVHATAQSYFAAQGMGRGVIFRIYFDEPENVKSEDLQLDSFFVHDIPVPAAFTFEAKKIMIEGNYFVMKHEPEPGNAPMPTLNSPDPIIYLSDYQPSIVYIRYKGKSYALTIESFDPIQE